MKLIIAGSRTLIPPNELMTAIVDYMTQPNEITEIVSGMAKGVDLAGFYWAINEGYKTKEFPANWEIHGKAAGPIRNGEMAKYADAILLIWDGESKGSANMKFEMEFLNKPIYEVILKESK